MLRIKKLSEVMGRNAYTDAGDFLGQVEEVNLSENKVDGWRIRIVGHMSHLIGPLNRRSKRNYSASSICQGSRRYFYC